MKYSEKVKTGTKQATLGLLLALFSGSLLVACGGDTAPPTPAVTQPTQPASNPASETPVSPIKAKDANIVGVQLSEWTIVPASLSVPPGKTRFVVTNVGEQTHNLVMKSGTSELARTPNFTKAENPKQIEADLQVGTYTWLCDIPGHAEQGMTGTVNVTP